MTEEMMTIPQQRTDLGNFLVPEKFEQLQRAAKLFAESKIVPSIFRGDVATCAVALELASRLDVHPFMLFQNLYVIKGKPAMEAKLLIALANSRAPIEGPIQYRFEGEGETRSCTAFCVHAKTKQVLETTISWEMVLAEGWNQREGSKWRTIPDLMFRYRSAAWLIRSYFPEVIMGLHSVDEVQDSRIIEMERSPVEAGKAEIVQPKKRNAKKEGPMPPESPAKTGRKSKKASILAEIQAYQIKPSLMTAYVSGSLGRPKPEEDWTEDDAEIILNRIRSMKGDLK